MENVIGRSVHLTPSGIDFDEHVFQLGQGTVVRAAGSLIFPRCCAHAHWSLMSVAEDNKTSKPYESSEYPLAAHVGVIPCCQATVFLVAMQGGPLSLLQSKILLGDEGVPGLSDTCRQLPVEEGEKLVKFKPQRFGLKALW